MAWAVSATTGIPRVASSALSWRVASQPSITGRLMSIRIRSGRSARAFSTPSAPSTAIDTSNPRFLSRRDSMSRFISWSSTSRIFCMRAGSSPDRTETAAEYRPICGARTFTRAPSGRPRMGGDASWYHRARSAGAHGPAQEDCMSELRSSRSERSQSAADLLALYEITRADLARIRKLGETVIPKLDDRIARFYDWLEKQPEYEEFFS